MLIYQFLFLKEVTIAIDPDDEDTNNHFGEQQVYGIVTKLIDISN